MRVEPRRDEDELRVELLDRRLDDVAKRPRVLDVAGARRQRDVERGLVARPGAAAARVERPLVERDANRSSPRKIASVPFP